MLQAVLSHVYTSTAFLHPFLPPEGIKCQSHTKLWQCCRPLCLIMCDLKILAYPPYLFWTENSPSPLIKEMSNLILALLYSSCDQFWLLNRWKKLWSCRGSLSALICPEITGESNTCRKQKRGEIFRRTLFNTEKRREYLMWLAGKVLCHQATTIMEMN